VPAHMTVQLEQDATPDFIARDVTDRWYSSRFKNAKCDS